MTDYDNSLYASGSGGANAIQSLPEDLDQGLSFGLPPSVPSQNELRFAARPLVHLQANPRSVYIKAPGRLIPVWQCSKIAGTAKELQ